MTHSTRPRVDAGTMTHGTRPNLSAYTPRADQAPPRQPQPTLSQADVEVTPRRLMSRRPKAGTATGRSMDDVLVTEHGSAAAAVAAQQQSNRSATTPTSKLGDLSTPLPSSSDSPGISPSATMGTNTSGSCNAFSRPTRSASFPRGAARGSVLPAVALRMDTSGGRCPTGRLMRAPPRLASFVVGRGTSLQLTSDRGAGGLPPPRRHGSSPKTAAVGTGPPPVRPDGAAGPYAVPAAIYPVPGWRPPARPCGRGLVMAP